MTNEPQVSPTSETKKKGNPWIIVDKLLRRVEVLVVAFRVLLICYCLSTAVIVLVLTNGAFAISFPTILGGFALCLILTISTVQTPILSKFHDNVKKLLNPRPNNQVQTETSQTDTIDSLFTIAMVESVMSDSVAIDISGDGGDCDSGDCGDGGDCGGGDGGGCD